MGRLKHWWRLMRAGLPRLWATIAVCVAIVGGSVALAVRWGFKHSVWGLAAAALGLILVVIVDGSYREFRSVEERHRSELDAQRDQHETELAALRTEHQDVIASLSAPVIADPAPDPNWVARCDDTSPDVLLFILDHKEDATATASFRYLRCEVTAPNDEPRRAEGQGIRQAGSLRIADYPASFFPGAGSHAPPARNGFWDFQWSGLKDGEWRPLTGDIHDVTGRPAVRHKLALGKHLMPGESLYSPEAPGRPEGLFTLTMQTDGNLVVEKNDGSPAWFASDTDSLELGNYLVLRKDGNLVLCTGAGKVLRESHTAGEGGKELHMQADGNLVLRADEGSVWSSRGFGCRWRRCPEGADGCICGTTPPSHA